MQYDPKQYDDIFKNHIVDTYDVFTLPVKQRMEYMRFREPGTVVRLINYIMTRGALIVFGDYGEAIYKWSEDNDLEWVAGLNLDYFHGKCQASPMGREFVSWDSDWLAKQIKMNLEQEEEEEGKVGLYKKFEKSEGPDRMGCKDDWAHWLISDEGMKFFGCDSYEYINWGLVIDTWCTIQFEGLKRAVAMLKAEGRLK